VGGLSPSPESSRDAQSRIGAKIEKSGAKDAVTIVTVSKSGKKGKTKELA
jgi:hypothetical protein